MGGKYNIYNSYSKDFKKPLFSAVFPQILALDKRTEKDMFYFRSNLSRYPFARIKKFKNRDPAH